MSPLEISEAAMVHSYRLGENMARIRTKFQGIVDQTKFEAIVDKAVVDQAQTETIHAPPASSSAPAAERTTPAGVGIDPKSTGAPPAGEAVAKEVGRPMAHALGCAKESGPVRRHDAIRTVIRTVAEELPLPALLPISDAPQATNPDSQVPP